MERRLLVAISLALFLAPSAGAEPKLLNGFALSPSSIPVEEIRAGGPERDGIPALDPPVLIPAATAPWHEDEMVVGVVVGGEARAYPLAILVWHELVNDTLGGRPILVSYCPLCGTALVFDRRVGGETLRFGVSGLLYQSDLLMFDRATDSLWSQISAKAEVGKRMGDRLTLLRSRLERWGAWREAHPETQVLSPETGHQRPYGRDPYVGYDSSEDLLEGVKGDERFHPKMPTLGLRTREGQARAYPAQELRKAGGEVRERFAGKPVRVLYDVDRQVFDAEVPDGIEVVEGYWFAWALFHPATEIYRAPESPSGAAP